METDQEGEAFTDCELCLVNNLMFLTQIMGYQTLHTDQ